jgi:tRNA A37 threonylcarbamoyladenosine dehydratase
LIQRLNQPLPQTRKELGVIQLATTAAGRPFFRPGKNQVGYSYVIDAIDSVRPKAALIAYCRRYKVPLVTTGGAGGQIPYVSAG